MDETQERLLGCATGANCFNCRNDEKMRESIEERLGHEIICPRSYLIGTPLHQLPDASKKLVIRRDLQKKRIPQEREKLTMYLESLEEKIPSELLEEFLLLKSTVLPNIKSPQTCIFGKGKISSFDLVCCGGRVTPTDIFACDIRDVTILRQCTFCDSYHPIMEKEEEQTDE